MDDQTKEMIKKFLEEKAARQGAGAILGASVGSMTRHPIGIAAGAGVGALVGDQMLNPDNIDKLNSKIEAIKAYKDKILNNFSE